MLQRSDPQLKRRLAELEVEPQLYLLRWLRLLFGREFHLMDTCGRYCSHSSPSKLKAPPCDLLCDGCPASNATRGTSSKIVL